MDHKEILLNAAKVVTERSVGYGTPTEGVARAASIASLILGDTYTAYEVAVILHAVKLSRISASPQYLDSYVDGINFLAFAAEFVGAADEKTPLPAGPRHGLRADLEKLKDLVAPAGAYYAVEQALAHKHEEDVA